MAVVYSYIRFSTKKQLEGDSLRRQVEDGEAWISRNGHKLADMKLRDLGVSAFRGRNKHAGALSTFLDGIRSGRVQPGSILLVENLDRLSREGMSEAKKVFEQILEAGVLIAVLRPYERLFTQDSVSDPFGLMEPLMAFHLAYLESRNKADRLRKLWDRKRADAVKEGPGFTFDRRCPSWVSWDKEKKAFVLNDGAEAVRFIFEKTAEGVGQRQVLAGLQKDFKPIGLSGKWNGSFIQKVLNDRAVLGERQPKTADDKGSRVPVGSVIVGYYPAVIDESALDQGAGSEEEQPEEEGTERPVRQPLHGDRRQRTRRPGDALPNDTGTAGRRRLRPAPPGVLRPQVEAGRG